MMCGDMKQAENSGIGRVGRSYPRQPDLAAAPDEKSRISTPLKVSGGIFALLAALGLIGWFLAR
jgi:hypothetical protein